MVGAAGAVGAQLEGKTVIEFAAFREWIANTVSDLSGIHAAWRCLNGQWALTTAEIGVVDLSSDFYNDEDQAYMRCVGKVPTHKRVLH